ncbi:ATP-dependent RNA helicase ddx18 [Saguinus oedipus]|uniref:ATP-dependent RNA helicase n=1 Tax=Saguinus oedipus TaxID=9490 RepID=A0ABQ9WI95_SAGOE|nr:ATP-dependent RNA helicase ddx18 [Saguinus oedipus]
MRMTAKQEALEMILHPAKALLGQHVSPTDETPALEDQEAKPQIAAAEPKKSAVLTNGEAAMQSPNSESKKKTKKKRKMTPKETENNVAKPDNYEDDNEVPSLPLGLTGAFEDTSFASLYNLVNENTLKAVKETGFTNMTEIQHENIRPLLEDRYLLAAAKTGSGKTLAFLIPAVELIKLKFMPSNGTVVLILSPARELAMQILVFLRS